MTPLERIPLVLAKIVDAVEPLGHAHWSFTLGNGAAIPGRARVEDGWLMLETERHHTPPTRSAWATLTSNAGLDGGARFALASRGIGLVVRADIALDPEVDVERRIIEASAGLTTAARGVLCASAPPTEVIEASPDLASRCRDTGWPVAPRGTRELTVDLGVPGAFCQAVVSARADGTIATVAPLLESAVESPPSEVGRRAVALLLLRLGGVVRLVRAAAAPDDPASLCLEVVHTHPTTVELAHAFAALAVACRLAAAEAVALYHDEAVARLYLQHRNDAVVPRAA